MDPLSIVASAVSLVQLCSIIVEGLRVVCEASNVNFAVRNLRDEISALGTILGRVEETFTALTDSPLRMRSEQDHARDVRNQLNKCGETLEALDQIIKTLSGKKGFAANLMRQIRLNKSIGNITTLKANIHCYTQMLQVSLMTISIMMHLSHRDSLDAMVQCLRELHQASLEVETSLTDDSDTLNPLAQVEKCKSSAEIAMEIANKAAKNHNIEYDPVNRKRYLEKWKSNPGPFPDPDDRRSKSKGIVDHGLWDDRETMDWLRKNGYRISELNDVSRPKAVRLAICEGREEILHFLLNQVGNNKARRALAAEAMDLAISASQQHILESLIKGQASIRIDEHLKSGHTPLITAILAGKGEIVQLLLQHGANIEARCVKEITPLAHAVRSRDPVIVCLLLQNCPSVDERTSCWTPLHFAVHYGDHDIVEQLLDEGADIEALCPRELPKEANALDPPISTNSERPDTNGIISEVEPYCTALYRAVVKGDDKMVELLLDQGADIGAKNPELASALGCAAEEQFEEIVELLLRKGANANKEDQWDCTPLHRAQFKLGSDKVTRLLLSSEADVGARCKKKRTPLHYAAESGNILTTPPLLDNGADIEAEDIAGNRPLHIAILYRQKDMVSLLVQHGANVTAGNSDGHDALTIATRDTEKQRKCPEIIEFLKEKSSNEFKVHSL